MDEWMDGRTYLGKEKFGTTKESQDNCLSWIVTYSISSLDRLAS